ncbi:MAG: HD domain-containing protein [Sphingobacteriales bacterium]|nr:MAG: HD domain-containing protein [Sphingobacteriales bacterium]TAF79463.1 MAG: HD domain-containing protein [Sphingobacteriales bacterium]
MNKHKIINDPIYGFISIKTSLIFDIIEHPYFQRLRYIKQLGMTHLVYPGALHTRFHHALGAMHLMQLAIEHLKNKGHDITLAETEAACIAILLHDIGHGPFSHALEHTIVQGISHEQIGKLLIAKINNQFDGKLSLAMQIFNNTYEKKFLYQLIAGQLDLDRLDYLNRDSFFSGVTEGMVSSDRIIKLLNIKNGHLVVEEKGIYSIEKFLIARRLMYWQVYLHKTVIAAEQMLVKILERARTIGQSGGDLFATPALKHFLYQTITNHDFYQHHLHLTYFVQLDDTDIMASIKAWCTHPDFILSTLCKNLTQRKLYKVEITNTPADTHRIIALKHDISQQFNLSQADTSYFVFTDTINNIAYNTATGNINILMKNANLQDITLASDNSFLQALAQLVTKNIFCYTKI